MKKLLSTLLFAFIAVAAFAQTNSFEIKGGLNFSKQTGHKLAFESLPGFNVGAALNVQFENFVMQPGLLFSVKGFKEKVQLIDVATATAYLVNSSVKFNYIEVPLNVLYKFPTKKAVRLYIGGGPYLAYATSGSRATDGQAKEDLSFQDYYRVDFGFNVTAGVEVLKKVTLSANYDFGVGDVDQIQTHNNTNNRTLGLSVGYLF